MRIGPDTDVTDVAVLMADYNLVTIPVVDAECRILGLITVDDVLETTLPDNWRQREASLCAIPLGRRVFALGLPSADVGIAMAAVVLVAVGALTPWRRFGPQAGTKGAETGS